MQNLNINKITRHSFVKETGTVKGIHCGSFACLLIKQQNATEEQPLYVIKQIDYDEVTHDTIIPIDICLNEDITADIEYLPFINSAFLATSTRILITDLITKKVASINIPLLNGDRCVATAWNCEQDCLAVAYASGRVMVFCINFHTFELFVLAEDHPNNKGNENVYLGWGDVKKQFKGKNVDEYLQENHPPESAYKDLSYEASISWQFGERFFLVNSVVNNERVVRIFDNECRLLHTVTKAKVPGMCAQTVFRSRHNTLATICQGNDAATYVVMHERNGEYYNTIFPFTNVKIENVKFSTCGRIFAIFSHSAVDNSESYFLDLYTQSNFIWTHKLRFSSKENGITLKSFRFLPTVEDIYSVELSFNEGFVIYEIVKSVAALLDEHTVYVQSGNTLQEFDYKKGVIPPCGVIEDILSIGEPINNVIVQAFTDNMMLVLVDSSEVAHIYQKGLNKNDMWTAIRKIDLKQVKNSQQDNYEPITWFKFLLSIIDDSKRLIAIGIQNNGSIKCTIPLEDDNVGRDTLPRFAFMHETVNENTVNFISTKGEQLRSVYYFDVTSTTVKCTLAHNGNLYINNECISKGTTSILQCKGLYLLMTITSFDDPMDRLFCIDIESFSKLGVGCSMNEISWSRRVEKGAILICMANDDGTVILEMPRGNIELVCVRPIILRNVYEKIVAGKFLEAYHLVRRLSMKLDVLYDLAPDLFHENVQLFVRSLGSAESVIKFLLPLKNTSTLTEKDFLFVQKHAVTDKKDKICDAIIEVYSNMNCDGNDSSRYRIICIALFVKHNHETYEALKYLVNHVGGVYTPVALLQLVDVVNMLKIYGDASEMYKQALTLYDVELASIIAQAARMDPQVYRKFLQRCQNADPVTKRFLMSNEGGNFKSAGLYLLFLYRKQAKTLEEFIEYVKDKDLLENVYKAMNTSDGDAMLKVSRLLCDKYVAKGMYKEAACVTCKAGLNNKAIDLLISGVCWMEAVKLIMYCDELSDESKVEKFEKLAGVCIAHGKHREAAYIFLERCRNVQKAMDVYLLGLHFKEVVDMLENPKFSAQVNKETYLGLLKKKLYENMKNTELNVDARMKAFELHWERLQVVREDRKHRAECTMDGDDAYSEAGSVTTRSHSSYASTTTRRTRKLEMKLRSLRHGGKFEDIALMRELYDIMNDVFITAADLKQLVSVYNQYAQINTDEIHSRITQLQQRMWGAADEIWPRQYAILSDDVLTADFLTENIVYLGKEYRSMPGRYGSA